MNTKITFAFFLLAFIAPVMHCFGQNVTPIPVPEEYSSNQYVVTVNGQKVPVFHAGLNVYFASFDFTGKVDVSVTAQKERGAKSTSNKYVGQVYYDYKQGDPDDFWKGNAQVRPLSQNIQTKTYGPVASFSLSEAGQYSVERPGTSNYLDQVLFLFANNPETDQPKAEDANVIYLEAGIHQKNIDLESGQTLYLAPGAVLFGAINIRDAKNVRIMGRGTVLYSGPQSEDKAPIGWGVQKSSGKNIKNWYGLTTYNVDGLTVSGVNIITRSRTFMVCMYSTFNAVFDNIKLIAVNQQNVNGDGFDWFAGGNTKISNCLIRSQDDCFAYYHSPYETPGTDGINKGMEIKNVLIENCVLWSTIANIYRVGHGGHALRTENITMKNCDVIHIGRGEWLAPWSVFCTVSPYGFGKAVHNNYLFENIRFEEPISFLGIQNEEVRLNNIVFKNITMSGEPLPSLVKCTIDGLSFDNVILNGKAILKKEDVPFSADSKVMKNLTFK